MELEFGLGLWTWTWIVTKYSNSHLLILLNFFKIQILIISELYDKSIDDEVTGW